jgi:hypothetical protein
MTGTIMLSTFAACFSNKAARVPPSNTSNQQEESKMTGKTGAFDLLAIKNDLVR